MFNGIWLVASEPLTVRGREYQTGERFELSRTKSGALLVTGRAMIAQKPVPPEPEPEPVQPRRRGRPRKTTEDTDGRSSSADSGGQDASQADASASASTEEELTTEATPTRRYRRRDLEAEV